MKADPIDELLRRADRAAGEPPVPDDLAGRVRRKARRRRLAAISAGVGVAVLLATVAVALWPGRPQTSRPTAQAPKAASHEEVTRLRAKIAGLRAEADSRAAVVNQMLARLRQQDDHLEDLQRQLDRPDPLAEVRRQIDRTAYIMVYQADHSRGELGFVDSPEQTYRRVIELFPDSRWADVARKRITEMQSGKGDTL